MNSTIDIYSWTKDKYNRFTSCSENVAQLAGLNSPREILGKTDFEMIWCNRANLYLQEEKIALAGDCCKQYQWQKTMNGDIKIFVTKHPIMNREGKIVGTVGSAINLTQTSFRKKKEYLDGKGRLQIGKVFNSNEYLTRRETSILKFILLGYPAKKIAISLNISPRTVETHIEKLKLKLQCRTKGEIIEFSVKNGLTYLCE